MLNDIKKSFNEIIYERTTSPFYGTLICSWLIWNWKIIYLTLFISENKLCENKIDYIIKNYCQVENIIWYPLASSIVILTIIPFLSNGAYWLSLKFNKWKVDQKNKVDRKQLLSLEQSIQLREEISNQEEKIEKIIEKYNTKIKSLEIELAGFKENKDNSIEPQKKVPNKNARQIAESDYAKLKVILSASINSDKLWVSFRELLKLLKENPDITIEEIKSSSSYPIEMDNLISILIKQSLIEDKSYYDNYGNLESILTIGTSFKEFLKMDLD